MIKKILRADSVERFVRWAAGKLMTWLVARGSYRGIVLRRKNSDGTEIPYDYLNRFYLLKTPWFGVFLHQFLADDPERIHDHPWANISVVLAGSYREQFHDGSSSVRRAGDVVFRQALMLHRIIDVADLPLTLFIRFRRRRRWGEMTPEGWQPIDADRRYPTRDWLFPRYINRKKSHEHKLTLAEELRKGWREFFEAKTPLEVEIEARRELKRDVRNGTGGSLWE